MKIWFDEDKNLSKTTFIFFGNRPTNTENKLMMNGIELERVSIIYWNINRQQIKL